MWARRRVDETAPCSRATLLSLRRTAEITEMVRSERLLFLQRGGVDGRVGAPHGLANKAGVLS